jgi:hypothetical protein
MNKIRLFLFSYYGAKSQIAHLYPAPVYDTIIEPFAGAANYSCLHFKKKVILFEPNPVIFSILDFLIKSSKKDILVLPLLKSGEKVSDLKVCQEAKWMIGMRVNQGVVRPRQQLTQRAIESPSSAWSYRGRSQLSYFVERIKHWKVFNQHCWAAFDGYRDAPVTWFIDPPYQGDAGKAYPNGSDCINFPQLGQEIQTLAGQVIVCEGEGADWLPFRFFRKNMGMGKKGKERKWELIYTRNCPAGPLFKSLISFT